MGRIPLLMTLIMGTRFIEQMNRLRLENLTDLAIKNGTVQYDSVSMCGGIPNTPVCSLLVHTCAHREKK